VEQSVIHSISPVGKPNASAFISIYTGRSKRARDAIAVFLEASRKMQTDRTVLKKSVSI
jgi:hypothetical protein